MSLVKKDEFSIIRKRISADIVKNQNKLYSQLESLSWLQKSIDLKAGLPPLRGWAASPDVLYKLYRHIIIHKPNVIVEFGSGSSTIVIASALKKNGGGTLYSIDHDDKYFSETLSNIEIEELSDFVDLRLAKIQEINIDSVNLPPSKRYWYDTDLIKDIMNIDLLWIDGPPGAVCDYSRYPALPVMYDKLAKSAEIWMDDTIRKEEKEICEAWKSEYNLDLTYFPLEKGLGVMSLMG